MLAGLLFATLDAADRPDQLAATLPFGGATLIEYQARSLAGLGVSQLVVAVSRMTPELLGAVNRIGRRGLAVDVVRSASEAAEKVHPLARIVMLADALVTTDAILAPFAAEGPEAMLVVDADHAPALERIDARTSWAGVARLAPARLVEASRLPREYDFQSTLLRVAAQAGAQRIVLTASAARGGHGIERDSHALAARGAAIVSSFLARRDAWTDRYVFGPLSRTVLPILVRHDVALSSILLGGVAAGVAGAALLALGWPVAGLIVTVLALAALKTGDVLAWLRGEVREARVLSIAVMVLAAVACLLVGRGVSRTVGTPTGWLLAVALLVAAALGERAVAGRPRRRWWGSPSCYPLLLLPFVAAAEARIGMAIVAGYATATLAAAIEALRREA